ncbi:phenylalanine--tRNA ligase subunit beta [Gilvimarinus sp. SDUM040013]|uniref:Phenylalanine--tRNA ligase beta subunit n=1 Tax=Gilvimarinus gilvus TaxID=3058038 RepID=A0ABU4RTC3_9GAMM|nr:phenylalanine--tRNA ligase subunit beta [Gilvimarinus sp. SDUM040013]MDO3386986.1 phenylalanine--tRNA ligase subunit beta [Gilvimarinus sp. SDUM040013]MDX6848120.1 phenylalanine--tRNA ligase subunit beta [Gilvimarinus sp. SDUM040013]
MKVSESWLREWTNPDIDTQAVVDQLTMAGIEVDATEPVAGAFSGVVVGEIVSIEQHPDADKLRVCQVAGHPDGGQMQVVCGAPNARAGLKIPFATVGAKLPGDFKIKKAKLRGVESLGMLCGQTELEAGDDDEGLWELAADAPVGADLRDYLNLNDTIIEVDITPNRGDCLSVRGLARELGVINRHPVSEVAAEPVAATIDDSLSVVIEAGEACPRYLGRVIRGVNVAAPSPLWMQEKLRRAGLRPIDAIVDVTNYVLLELGQPMHAFDLAKLDGGIVVREANAGETLTLLDEQEIELKEGTLLIADNAKPLAMAGIMGGLDSSVTKSTQDIFLESAFFNPIAIAGRARSYGLHTDSSHRFERGVDYELARQAMERATELLISIVGGKPGPVNEQTSDAMPQAGSVGLRKARIVSGLSIEMDDATVTDIVTRLGFGVEASSAEGWQVRVPSWRFDVSIEADLLEELARIYGYNRLPTKVPDQSMAIKPHTESRQKLARLRSHLIGRRYQEVVTYSFIDPKLAAQFEPEIDPVALQNPISTDMGVMRTSLLPGLVSALRHNINRQQARVRLFESGQKFVPNADGVAQTPTLAGLLYGPAAAENWADADSKVDFFDLKGDVESLLSVGGNGDNFEFKADTHPALHPGQTAGIFCKGAKIGVLGAIHPALQDELDLPDGVFVFEVALDPLLDARVPAFSPLSKFPAVRRDLALLVDRELPVDDLLKAITDTAGEHLYDLKVFDLYMGKGIDPHRKSVALGLTFQHPSRTLNDEEINGFVDAVVSHVTGAYGATLR